MKCLSAIIGLSLLALGARAALPQPDLIAQIHFAGAQKISADPHSKAFTNEFCSPEALALRAQTASKLSAWLAGWLQTNLNLNAAVPDGPPKLLPLFDDLQTAEWFLEIRAAANGKPEAAIAIKLDPAHSQLWQTNLKLFFPSATFKSADGWLIFDSDPALLKLGDQLAQKISAPPADWLDVDINWPRLAQWHPLVKELALPETQFALTAPDNYFIIKGKLYFPENLALNLEPWRVPTNTVRTPFDSFTAVRGIGSWLKSQTWAQPYLPAPTPDQLFAWSLPMTMFQTFVASPVPDASSALSQVYDAMIPPLAAANDRHEFLSPIIPEKTNDVINMTGIPYAGLQLKALSEKAGQFLVAQMFPNTPRSQPLPPELFQRLATKDLVYYHWEMTSNRMDGILHISQLGLAITKRKQLEASSAAFKWIQAVGPTLANTRTEIVQSGPAEMTFSRNAPGIFTAAELYMLANWLEAPNFPGCDLNMSSPHPRKNRPGTFQFTTPMPAK
jgi:hypothetical protein